MNFTMSKHLQAIIQKRPTSSKPLLTCRWPLSGNIPRRIQQKLLCASSSPRPWPRFFAVDLKTSPINWKASARNCERLDRAASLRCAALASARIKNYPWKFARDFHRLAGDPWEFSSIVTATLKRSQFCSQGHRTCSKDRLQKLDRIRSWKHTTKYCKFIWRNIKDGPQKSSKIDQKRSQNGFKSQLKNQCNFRLEK